jgi:5-methylthioadenosine/S-adenosylhomocysteine deaminase
MPHLITNAVVVTNDSHGTIHHGADILVSGNRIEAIAPGLAAHYPGLPRTDATHHAVFPGLANIHTHFVMTLARGVFEDLSPPHRPPFCGGLSPIPLPPLTAREQAVMCQLGALEAIRSGTTAVIEDAVGIAAYAREMAATGLRMVLAERAWDRKGASIGDPAPFLQDDALGQAGLARIEALHAEWDGAANGRIRVGIAAWAPDMCSPGLLQALRALADRLGAVSTIHLNQIWGEVAAIQAHRGMLPTEYLYSIGFLAPTLVAAHCRCMTAAEEATLGRHRVKVAFNSAIAARRGLSPRICTLEDAGCTIGMGTDNMAEDMVEVMRTGLFMERVRRQDGRNPTPEQALNWATKGGYQAMGIPDGGVLVPGALADLILVRTTGAHMTPFLRPTATFVHQGQANDITHVMVDGQWVMQAGQVLTMDEAAIIQEANRIALTAWSRLFAENPDLPRPEGFIPLPEAPTQSPSYITMQPIAPAQP